MKGKWFSLLLFGITNLGADLTCFASVEDITNLPSPSAFKEILDYSSVPNTKRRVFVLGNSILLGRSALWAGHLDWRKKRFSHLLRQALKTDSMNPTVIDLSFEGAVLSDFIEILRSCHLRAKDVVIFNFSLNSILNQADKKRYRPWLYETELTRDFEIKIINKSDSNVLERSEALSLELFYRYIDQGNFRVFLKNLWIEPFLEKYIQLIGDSDVSHRQLIAEFFSIQRGIKLLKIEEISDSEKLLQEIFLKIKATGSQPILIVTTMNPSIEIMLESSKSGGKFKAVFDVFKKIIQSSKIPIVKIVGVESGAYYDSVHLKPYAIEKMVAPVRDILVERLKEEDN